MDACDYDAQIKCALTLIYKHQIWHYSMSQGFVCWPVDEEEEEACWVPAFHALSFLLTSSAYLPSLFKIRWLLF